MKVAQINATSEFGSTGRIVSEISDYLFIHNIDNIIMYGDGVSNAKKSYYIGSKFDHKIHALCSRLFGLQGYYSKAATKKMINMLDKFAPDIVHLHNLHSNYINIPMLLKYLSYKDIATVITLHDCWLMTGKCTHYTQDKCYKWKTGCKNCIRLKKDIPSWFFDRTSKMWLDKNKLFNSISRLAVIGVSDWITNEAMQSFFRNASIIKRIYNWIDLDDFYPIESDIRKKYNIDERKFMILSVSAGWNENSDRFKDAIKLSNHITEDMQIVLVGKGLNQERLPGNIIGIDYIDGKDELAKIYSAADVYVHLSREDTFGKVVAEAMACGTPAVVYNSTALPEFITNDTGFVVDCGDINQICEKIIEIKTIGKRRYSNYCTSFVGKQFEKEMLLKETAKLYCTINE